MIQAANVSKWYGPVRALHGVSFEVPRGQIVGILGPNGAGKTTTIRITTGFFPPTSGSVSVCGHDTVGASLEARSCIGYLPDAVPLYTEMAVEGYLDYRARLYGLGRADRRREIGRVVERCSLGDVLRRRTGQLSKGYRQRVGLAAALLHDPAVLILDEPVSGLDPTQILEVRRLIRELAHDKTVLLSSHILTEVEATCDRVIIIAGGTVRADGTPRELMEQLAADAPYIVEVRAGEGGGGRVAAVLRSVIGVAAVETAPLIGEPGGAAWVRCTVAPHATAPDLREAIAGALGGAGGRGGDGAMTVRELRRERPTLEQFFLQVTGPTPGAGKGAA